MSKERPPKTTPQTAPAAQKPHTVSRRELLAGTAATVACAFVPASSLRLAEASADSPTREILTTPERRLLEAMVSRIIPAGPDGPSALEAGCARYIESALADAYESLQPAYRAGLEALESRAMSSAQKSFATLAATEQDKILSEFEKNIAVGDYTASAAFFEMVRHHTFEGMFGDPSYGGNANFAGWNLIGYPGPRMRVPPELQNMNAKIPRSRLSVEKLVHGSH